MIRSVGTHSRSHRLRCVSVFIVLGALTQLVQAQTVVRGPYLQLGTSDGVTIRWRTDSATDSVVRFGSAPESLSQTAAVSTSTTEHGVTIEGLTADTRYYYSVGSSSAELAGADDEHFFVTSPQPGDSKPTRIWVIGDSGTANDDAMAVRNAFLTFTGARDPDLWLMLGDNAYSDGTDAEYQEAVFDMYPGLLRKSVLWPTLGNHDAHNADSASQSGPYYDIFELPTDGSAGGVPSGTEAYYSFDYGDIHIVCLDSADSDNSPGGTMMTWLTTDLQANDKHWVLAFWHHPPYSKGSHDSDSSSSLSEMRENALPILEDYGVDLVLSGHSHSYERSYLIDGHYGESSTFSAFHQKDSGDGSELGDGAYQKPFVPGASHEGAVYTVAGSSGKTSGGKLDHAAMVVSLDRLGSVVLDIDGVRMDAKFLDNNGNVLDDFTILKGPDTTSPAMTGVAATGISEVVVTYSERVEASSSVDINNYTIDNGVAVTGAVLSEDLLTVTLTTTQLAPGTYTLTVNNVSDLAGNVIDVDSQASFDYVQNFNPSFQDGVLPNTSYSGTRDSFISEGQPTSNNGSSSSLSADGSASSGTDDYALVKWDVTAIPPGSMVTAADIVIQVTNSSGGPYELYEVRRDWVESQVTWNQAATGSPWEIAGAQGPTDRAATILGTIGSAGSGSYTITLNADGRAVVESWINDPSSNHGILVGNSATSDGLDFSSRDSGTASNRPRLNVTYTSADSEPPTAPSGLAVAWTSETEVRFVWDASTDDTGVAEYIAYQDGFETGRATGTSFTATGLTPDTSYDFFVTALDFAGNESSPSATVTSATDPDVSDPTPPGTPTLVSRTDTAVTISWTAATDNVGVVSYDVREAGAVVGSTSEPTRTFTHTALTADTSYSYSITAWDASNNVSAPSGDLVVTTLAAPDTESPTPPGIPSLDSKTDTTVTFSWTPATDNVGVVSYEVHESGTVVGSTSEPNRTFTHTGLASETNYSYVVTAWDGAANESAPSGALNVTTDPTPQPSLHVSGIALELRRFGRWQAGRAVVNVADENDVAVEGATVTVQWSGLATNTDSGVTAGGSIQLDSDRAPIATTGQFTMTVTDLTAAGYIYDQMANVQTAACVDTGGQPCTMGPPDTDPPAAPTSLVASAGPGSVALDWADNAEPDLASYSVYRSTMAGTGHVLIATGIANSDFLDSGLNAGPTYYYVVTATDSSGNESAPSNEASGTPSQATMHTSAINVGTKRQGKHYRGTATVTVVDQDVSTLSGVVVEGDWTWNGASIGSASGVTDGSGVATIESSKQRASAGDVFEFTVTNLTLDGYVYDPASDVENPANGSVP